MKSKTSSKILMGIIVLFVITTLFAKLPYDKLGIDGRFNASLFGIDDTLEPIKLPDNFSYVYERFKVFNPEIDTATVITFNNVCAHYRLDTTNQMLEWVVGQIMLESGAKQYYETGHPKEGKLVLSVGGAVGMAQIMPNTAYGNLMYYVSDEEAEDMYSLGATPIDFIKKDTNKSALVNMSSKWLENQTNNMIMWGFIMRRKIDDTNNILKVLVSYNAGAGGMQNYINNGGSLNSHHYIKSIRQKLKYAEENI